MVLTLALGAAVVLTLALGAAVVLTLALGAAVVLTLALGAAVVLTLALGAAVVLTLALGAAVVLTLALGAAVVLTVVFIFCAGEDTGTCGILRTCKSYPAAMVLACDVDLLGVTGSLISIVKKKKKPITDVHN